MAKIYKMRWDRVEHKLQHVANHLHNDFRFEEATEIEELMEGLDIRYMGGYPMALMDGRTVGRVKEWLKMDEALRS